MEQRPTNPKRPPSNAFLRYSGMAIQMAVTIGGCVWAGLWLDQRFNPGGKAFTLCLSIVGVGLAMFNVIRDLSRT